MSAKRFAAITGVGSATPNKVLTNNDLSKIVDTTDEWIRERTGILERRIAEPHEATSDFALLAGEKALEMSGISAGGLDAIFVATCTPDTLFPSTACRVQDRIGAHRAAAMDISAACTGFNYALEVASAYIEAGRAQHVLVAGADTLSKFTNWKDRSTCVLFGDGAGAVILSASLQQGIVGSYLRARGSGGPLLCIPGGGALSPEDPAYIYMNGKEVFKFAVEVMVESVRKLLDQCGKTLDEIALVIPHQANIRIIDMAAKRLSLKRDRLYINLQKYGNTSAASIPLALDEAVRGGNVKEGDLILLTGFGAGLTYGANIVRWIRA